MVAIKLEITQRTSQCPGAPAAKLLYSALDRFWAKNSILAWLQLIGPMQSVAVSRSDNLHATLDPLQTLLAMAIKKSAIQYGELHG